ncbi:MAG: hypothetical protein ACREQV_10140, partial [Candidatus Binatia bacterium]
MRRVAVVFCSVPRGAAKMQALAGRAQRHVHLHPGNATGGGHGLACYQPHLPENGGHDLAREHQRFSMVWVVSVSS